MLRLPAASLRPKRCRSHARAEISSDRGEGLAQREGLSPAAGRRVRPPSYKDGQARCGDHREVRGPLAGRPYTTVRGTLLATKRGHALPEC